MGNVFSVKIGERNTIQSDIEEVGVGVIQCYIGSHIDKKTVAGMYFKPYEILHLDDQTFGLRKLATVYEAEVIVITNGADMIMKADIRNQTIFILFNSQTALRAIASQKWNQLLVGNSIDNLNILNQNNHVRLMWVPEHSDFEES